MTATARDPAPPPSAAAEASFYRRPLPDGQIAFSSLEGRQLFREALAAGHMEGWFALSEQFHTQAEPAFCGLGTLVVVLNALEIDPGRIWKGPWRWYGEDLLDCCQPLEKVQRLGLTIDELACLAQCNGASATVVRADADAAGAGISGLRETLRTTTAAARGPVLVAGYSRANLGQTGGGHFSPLAGYHPGRDLALVLDVARFKYPPHWVPLPRLWHAMTRNDPATGRARGWMVLERGAARSMPLYFRMSAGDGLGESVAALLEDAPRLLASLPAETTADLVRGWVQAAQARLADRLHHALGPFGQPSDLPPEHRQKVETLLHGLHATTAYQLVRQARPDTPAGHITDDVLAVLLLALPEVAVADLPAPTRAALTALRQLATLGPALAQEITALRDQLTALRLWSCGRPPL